MSKDLINQLFNFMAKQDIHPDGYEQITLSWFDRGVGELNEAELDRLVELSPNLTKLTVNNMRNASDENLEALTTMTQRILSLPELPLTYLDLEQFSYTAQHGEDLLRALSSMTQKTLLGLNLGNNLRWWRNESCFSLLLEVLQKQEQL